MPVRRSLQRPDEAFRTEMPDPIPYFIVALDGYKRKDDLHALAIEIRNAWNKEDNITLVRPDEGRGGAWRLVTGQPSLRPRVHDKRGMAYRDVWDGRGVIAGFREMGRKCIEFCVILKGLKGHNTKRY
ncbi:uncharacterized protein FRV6_02632 [Fusarium oxysporum]|uniref:Uncharacterized protein n=1 Tax=Fusarium oxysporum TaxID=5507 RepID=A0A2H3STA4_FUSOX|nr:uncharacterized protein FRV6_02632 [Fusarium oxysporum]